MQSFPLFLIYIYNEYCCRMERKTLVDLCREGEKQALEELYRLYSKPLLRICRHYVTDPEMAQDLLHDSFIVIFTSINTLRNTERLESWMSTIVRNLALRYLNRQQMFPTLPLADVAEEEVPADLPQEEEFPRYEQLMEWVERLPEGYGQVFKLAVLEGLSHKEIGEKLGIAPHSSSSQLFRAKKLLRQMAGNYRTWIVALLLALAPQLHDGPERRPMSGRTAHKLPQSTLLPDSTAPQPAAEAVATLRPLPPPAMQPVPPVIPATGKATDELRLHPAPPTVRQATAESTPLPLPRMPLPTERHKKGSKWRAMLAGSLAPQAVHNLYRLLTLPGNDIASGAPLQQIETWEEYYDYLSARHQAGKLGSDSLFLMQMAAQNSGKMEELQQHDRPLTIGLSLSKELDRRWSLESGLQYIQLKSTFTSGTEYKLQEVQKLHYIGIPLRLSYKLWEYKGLSVRSAAGLQLDIPVKGSLQTVHMTDMVAIPIGKRRLSVPLQGSVNAGISLQLRLTPRAGLFVEPTVNYYLPDGSSLRTIRKEHPLTFSLPVGIRLTW